MADSIQALYDLLQRKDALVQLEQRKARAAAKRASDAESDAARLRRGIASRIRELSERSLCNIESDPVICRGPRGAMLLRCKTGQFREDVALVETRLAEDPDA